MDVDFPVDVVVTFHVQGGPEPANLILLGSAIEDEVSGDVTGLRIGMHCDICNMAVFCGFHKSLLFFSHY